MQTTAEQVTYSNGSVSFPVTILVLLITGFVFLFGHLYARMQRAHADRMGARAAIKELDRGFWALLRRVVKIGFWLFVIFVGLTVWSVNSLRHDGSPQKPVPAKATVSATPSHRR